MDFRTVVTVSTLLLMTTADGAALEPNTTPLSTESVRVRTNSSSSSAAPAATAAPTPDPGSSAAPFLGLLAVRWTSKCGGHLILYHPSASSAHVCHDSETAVRSLLTNVCENKKGCKDTLRWHKGRDMQKGYHVSEGGAEQRSSCETLAVQCTAEPVEVLPDVQGQLRAHKVVTALLCCILLVLLLIRFTRPTVKALQKRFSDRRQNRWVGPTQSHSVSYHRGKTAVKNNDEENRLSFSALERLAVSDSREPSSNRNSDYNF
ncbi:uncharacterized protein LOC118312466 isoform X2 [Scophthalmus maximus]|uniref:uncharacterized protein LOC118312466 isoform X2 n=1 Tax=Scophthalmus maximus TaxID=52904 RepID=UPI0015E11C53|nr:uncharacterized protein LOC118312466 isoform X2 [Scophthalmus maximus]